MDHTGRLQAAPNQTVTGASVNVQSKKKRKQLRIAVLLCVHQNVIGEWRGGGEQLTFTKTSSDDIMTL